ncbi:MAG: hypothetical protein H6746_14160 [Deltaproteobacteria bacterium]|nr:hypothetical protein [Deltaproteobacteria bacterium]
MNRLASPHLPRLARVTLAALALSFALSACDDGGTKVGDTLPSVVVSDQSLLTPRAVVVDSVATPVDGWIVIHEDDGSGAFGDVIGYAPVAAGTSVDVGVTLDRDAVNGETLYAMLHIDGGEIGTYEFPGSDVPATTASGDIIAPAFEVLDGGAGPVVPSVTVVDQAVSPANSVVVAQVVSDGPGFIVIHEDDGSGSFGAVIGHAAVVSGANLDVRVTLERDASNGETLYAMLHTDAGTVGTYEFPGPDGPVMDGSGAVIAPPFEVLSGGTGPATPDVTVVDQNVSPANSVVVSMVVSDGPGFIVIHEDDGSGSFGAVIGHTAVADGANTEVRVTLDRDAVNGETLYAMLHTDAGTVGTYEFPGPDGPVMDGSGAVIAPPFVVLGGGVEPPPVPSVTVNAQTADPADQVVVAEVVSDGPGFIVIHEDDGSGTFGAVIGHAAVADGSNADVTVTLDRDAVDGETLYAMLHTDAGTVGTYEFPGPDGPVMDGSGAVIAPPFVVTVAAPVTNAVEVANQGADPIDHVVVAKVTADVDGFIVIHEDDGSGSFGAVIGYSAVSAGTTSDVAVDLDRQVVQGETLYAMLHIDAGTAGTYEFPGPDAPATDAAGEVVVEPFVVSVVEKVEVSDKGLLLPLDPLDQVTVDTVVAQSPAFIVIHESSAPDVIGDVIGYAPVPAGRSTDVVVMLDRDVVAGETLWAMLHLDEGEPGVYEFPGVDVPAKDAAGDVIVEPFEVQIATP